MVKIISFIVSMVVPVFFVFVSTPRTSLWGVLGIDLYIYIFIQLAGVLIVYAFFSRLTKIKKNIDGVFISDLRNIVMFFLVVGIDISSRSISTRLDWYGHIKKTSKLISMLDCTSLEESRDNLTHAKLITEKLKDNKLSNYTLSLERTNLSSISAFCRK